MHKDYFYSVRNDGLWARWSRRLACRETWVCSRPAPEVLLPKPPSGEKLQYYGAHENNWKNQKKIAHPKSPIPPLRIFILFLPWGILVQYRDPVSWLCWRAGLDLQNSVWYTRRKSRKAKKSYQSPQGGKQARTRKIKVTIVSNINKNSVVKILKNRFANLNPERIRRPPPWLVKVTKFRTFCIYRLRTVI